MRPKNSTKLVFWAMITCFWCWISSASADTLEQAVNETIATHPQILSAESSQLAANQDIKQQKGGYLPKVDIFTGDGPEYTNNPATRAAGEGSVNLFRQESNFLLSQLLFDGGNVSNRVKKAKADYQTSTFQVYEAQEALGYDAALAYLTVMQDRELLAISGLNVAAHQDIYHKIARRVQAGAGKKSDLDLGLSRLALAKSNYVQQQGQLRDDEATYFKVIGKAPSASLDMPPQPQNVPMTLQQAQDLAVQLNPSLSASKAQIASNIAAVGVAKSAYFPTITLDLNASFNDSLDGVQGYNNEHAALVHMNYNVFRGGSDKAAISAARYRVISAQQDTEALQRNILETVAFDWDGLQTALRRIPELQVHTTQSYNVWQAYIKQFQLGQRTLFDLLNAQSEYYDGRLALVEAQYQARILRYKLLASIGELVSTVKNPGFNQQPVNTGYPGSSIKQIKVTVPTSALDNTAAIPTDPNAPPKVTPSATLSNPHPTATTNGNQSWSYPTAAPAPSSATPTPTNSTQTNPANPANNPNPPATPATLVIPSLKSPTSLNETNAPGETNTPAAAAEQATVQAPSAASNQLTASLPSTTKAPHYAVQILASEDKNTLVTFAQKNHLSAADYTISQVTVNGTPWYHLAYGNYQSLADAKLMKQAMVLQMRGITPIIIKTV